mmetsp:Transcript_30459/g.64308  ORF Transcript_30459/g.64308 Transcript_30459/m.64308 type:complete len:82 (-) Transcript_30459:1901-2146(-)
MMVCSTALRSAEQRAMVMTCSMACSRAGPRECPLKPMIEAMVSPAKADGRMFAGQNTIGVLLCHNSKKATATLGRSCDQKY